MTQHCPNQFEDELSLIELGIDTGQQCDLITIHFQGNQGHLHKARSWSSPCAALCLTELALLKGTGHPLALGQAQDASAKGEGSKDR